MSSSVHVYGDGGGGLGCDDGVERGKRRSEVGEKRER